MGNFVSLNTALSGIRAAQLGLDTTTHNVANSSTPGFTRQRVDLRSSLHYPSPAGPMGTGVEVAGISRSRDAFLDARARTLGGTHAFDGTTAELLGRAEAVLGEPDAGVSVQLGALWDAFEDLAADPAEGATRQQVVTVLGTLAGRVRAVASGYDQLARDTGDRLVSKVDEANALLQQVADLNRQVAEVRLREGTPNDLLDQRDRALDALGELLGAEVRFAGGDAQVLLGGTPLVDGIDVTPLTYDAGTGELQAGGTVVDARGEVGALRDFLAVGLPAERQALDDFVTLLVGTLNDRHAQGFVPGGAAGGPLLELDAAGGAGSLRVAAGVSAATIAAAADPAAAPHDGRNAEALAALRSQAVGGATLGGRYEAMVVRIGGGVAAARAAEHASGSLSQAAQVARMSMHGVSLDEEMAALVQYQRALEAASRVMTAVDQALDVLVNRTGIVGR